MTMEIKLADDAATSAWKTAGLGDFDPDSDLADDIDADDDGVITESEIKTYEEKKSDGTKSSGSDTESSEYEVDPTSYYSAVDITEAPKDYGDMQDVLKKCIDSFDGIVKFITDLITKSNDLKTELDTVSSEIDEISADSETASGQDSADSTVAESGDTTTTNTTTTNTTTDTTDTTDTTGTTEATDTTDTTDATTSTTNSSTSDQLTDKTDKANKLINAASDNSANLDKATKDIGVTDSSVDKVMKAVGKPEKKSIWSNLTSAFSKTTKDCEKNPLVALVAGGDFIKNLSGKDEEEKEKDKVRALGNEAEEHSKTAKSKVSEAGTPLDNVNTSANKLQTILNNKKAAADKKQ